MPDGRSVPIVSQTEIYPMKTAVSLMLARHDDGALTKPLPVPTPPGLGGYLTNYQTPCVEGHVCECVRYTTVNRSWLDCRSENPGADNMLRLRAR